MSLLGIGVSPGVAIGPIRRVNKTKLVDEVPASPRQVFQALEQVASDLEKRAENISLNVAREVLQAQAMIARDPALVEAIGARLPEDIIYSDIKPALEEAFLGFKQVLESIGGYFAERVSDLDEIATRTIAFLSGVEDFQLVLNQPSIIVAEDLTPADTADLNLNFALALVVEKGGPTSHTAIVARGLGIPAIVGCPGAMDLIEGSIALVDGRDGSVVIDPTDAEFESRNTREESFRARASSVKGSGRLSDGTPVTLMANAGNTSDAIAAVQVGAEGIGLFRTELLFLNRIEEPTVDEQVELYIAVFEAMSGEKVVLRTLDAGSDKPVPFINAIPEENPALGVRGWRLNRTAKYVLDRQLKAVALAASQVKADVWVMAPMISTSAEASDFAKRARDLGIKRVGVMIETPAAAISADKILAEVDFASLGTNDLTQYVMAADRLDSRLSDLTSTWHPAVLRIIGQAASAATAQSKPIGVCGESAANPQLAAVLIGLGVTSLSMAPSALSEVRGFLTEIDRTSCVHAANSVKGASSAEEAKDIATEILGI